MDRIYDYEKSVCSACGAELTKLLAWPIVDEVGEVAEVGETDRVLVNLCGCGKQENLRSRFTTRCPEGSVFVFEEAVA